MLLFPLTLKNVRIGVFVNNIAFEIGLATAQTAAAFGIMPWQKQNIEAGEKRIAPVIRWFIGICQTSAAVDLAARAMTVVANKEVVILYRLLSVVSAVPLFFGLNPENSNEGIRKYASIIQRIQQVAGLALSLTIAAYGSPAYGITSACWISFGLLNEYKDYSKNMNFAIIGVVGISSLAVAMISKIPDHRLGFIIALVTALAQFQWVKAS